jgi:hypothetical protein
MEKIRNGDPVLYKEQQGIVYGKPREVKSKGLVYTIRIGDDYFKAYPSEIRPTESK